MQDRHGVGAAEGKSDAIQGVLLGPEHSRVQKITS
jgi:hypothetical protein